MAHIPGLFQAPDYARAIFLSSRLRRSTQQIEDQTAARMIRQERLTEDDPLKLRAIVDEGALWRPIGSPKIMRAALQHLLGLIQLPNVMFQVVPTETGAHTGMGGAFTLLSFPEDDDPDVVYIEHPLGALHLEKPEEAYDCRLGFEHLRGVALPPNESAAVVRQVIDEL